MCTHALHCLRAINRASSAILLLNSYTRLACERGGRTEATADYLNVALITLQTTLPSPLSPSRSATAKLPTLGPPKLALDTHTHTHTHTHIHICTGRCSYGKYECINESKGDEAAVEGQRAAYTYRERKEREAKRVRGRDAHRITSLPT